MINFTVDEQEIKETLEVNKFYNSTSGTDHTTLFSFDAATFQNFKKKGMLFQGHGVLLKKAVLKAIAKEGDEEPATSEVFWEGDEMLDWGDGLQLQIPGERFENYGKGVKLIFSYTLDFTDYNMIQLFYGDWKANPSFVINGKEIDKEYSPGNVHGLKNGDDGVSELTFNEDVYNQLIARGMAVQGHGIRLKKVEIASPESTGIQSIMRTSAPADGVIYNLSGQRVNSPRKGIYIKNGRKYIVR